MASEWIAFGNVWMGISRIFGQALVTKFGRPEGPVAKKSWSEASKTNWNIRHHKNGGLSHQQVESSSGDTPPPKKTTVFLKEISNSSSNLTSRLKTSIFDAWLEERWLRTIASNQHYYALVNIQKNYGASPFWIGKSTNQMRYFQ